MLILRHIARHRLPEVGRRSSRWVLLGVDRSSLALCRKVLGQDRRLDVAAVFQRIAEELRQPYLNEVARFGSLQRNQRGWFSSSLAFRNLTNSLHFILICQRFLVERLRETAALKEDVLVLIEDPWLYEECRRSYDGRPDVDCGRPVRLWAIKTRLFIRGVLSRGVWFLRTLRSLVIQLRHSRVSGPFPERVDCLLYSLPNARCLAGADAWKDPFLGELDVMLQGRGYSVGRFAPVGTYGFEAELAKRSRYIIPMLLQCTMAGYWRSLTASWRLEPSVGFHIQSLDLSLLAQREWWVDASYARWSEYRLFLEGIQGIFRRCRPATVIYPFENQPWEKLLVITAREQGILTLGYQHSLIGRYESNHYFGEGEARTAPLPDFILTSGTVQRDILISMGVPASICIHAGSLRFNSFPRSETGSSRLDRPRNDSPDKRILVVIGHQRSAAEALLEALNDAFPDHGRAGGLSFHLRPHPTLDSISRDLAPWMPVVRGELAPQLPRFDVVLSVGTTVALEARMLGLPVIIYRLETMLDAVDISYLMPEGSIGIATDRDIGMRVREASRLSRSDPSLGTVRLWESLFSPVDQEAWLRCLAKPMAQ